MSKRLAPVGWGVFLWVCAASAHAEAYRFPVLDDATRITAACEETLAGLKAREQRIEALKQPSAKALLAAFDDLNLYAEDRNGPLDFAVSVHPDKAIRDAAEACSVKSENWNNAFKQNARVYALLKAARPADAVDRSYLRKLVDEAEDSGVALPDEKRARAQALNNELTKQITDFSRNVREDRTKVPFTEAELDGVPSDVWKGATRDDAGRVLLGLDYPSSIPVMDKANAEAARERMWRAVNRKGGEANIAILTRVLDLRREYASLFGFDSYDDFALRRKMAGSQAAVQKFLDDLKAAVATREVSDIELLRRAKAEQLKTAFEQTRIARWDMRYYMERVRQAKYQLDKDAFRPYFPPEASLEFVFRLATRLFGVEFARSRQTLWHADAQAFEVKDAKTHKTLGTLFVDLYPRADKYTHAAVWSFRRGSVRAGRAPAAGMAVNFNRQGLDIDELETLLHEFGHAMHSLLTQARYSEQAGTSVKRDFVEAPSQMLEDWVYDDRVLALFQEVCRTCKPVPADLLAKARDARYYARGIFFARQHLYASYDLSLYGRERREPLAEWSRMEGATPLGTVDGTLFPAAFEHILQGYAAGYYGYLWSLVLAEDLRTAFEGRKLDPAVGMRYRNTVLARGGEVEPAELMRRFLGRDTNSNAFFTSLNRQ